MACDVLDYSSSRGTVSKILGDVGSATPTVGDDVCTSQGENDG